MESPAKVIAAFVGVFIAGAVFGGFFSVGIGARWRAIETPAPAVAAPAVPTAPSAETSKEAGRPKAGAAVHRAQLLQVPLTWQAPMLMRRYAERLDLTREQKQRINPLFQRATEDYRRVQQNTFRETAIILQRLEQDLAKELTPEQRKTLQDMEAKRRETLRKMERQREQQKKAGNRPKAAPETGTASPAPAQPSESTSTVSTSAPATTEAPAAAMPAETSTTSSAPEKRE